MRPGLSLAQPKGEQQKWLLYRIKLSPDSGHNLMPEVKFVKKSCIILANELFTIQFV